MNTQQNLFAILGSSGPPPMYFARFCMVLIKARYLFKLGKPASNQPLRLFGSKISYVKVEKEILPNVIMIHGHKQLDAVLSTA